MPNVRPTDFLHDGDVDTLTRLTGYLRVLANQGRGDGKGVADAVAAAMRNSFADDIESQIIPAITRR